MDNWAITEWALYDSKEPKMMLNAVKSMYDSNLDVKNFHEFNPQFVPEWVKLPTILWLDGAITDVELSNILKYLTDEKIIH